MEGQSEITRLSRRYGVIDLLTAAIMRNNKLDYVKAQNIAMELCSSDYIFDRLMDEIIYEMETKGEN